MEELQRQEHYNVCKKCDRQEVMNPDDICEACKDEAEGEAEMQVRFTYHAPKPGQPEKYVAIRDAAKELCRIVTEQCPKSREKERALDRIDEVVMWANASVARRSK